MVPNEDTGTIMGVVTLPPGTSQERAMEVLNRVDSLVAADPAVESRTVISGFSFIGGQGPSYGSLIIKLKNWEERSTMQNSTIVYATLFMRAQKIIKEAQVLFFAPPMIPGYSASSDIELNMQDKTGGDLNHFFEVVNNYTAALEARPEINSAKLASTRTSHSICWILMLLLVRRQVSARAISSVPCRDTSAVCMPPTSIASVKCTA